MRYSLRTLLILMAIIPPIIGFWPAIKKQAVEKAAQVTASDIVIVGSLTSLILIRIRLDQRVS